MCEKFMEKSEILNVLQNKGRLDRNFQYAINLTIEKYIRSIKLSLFREKYCQIYKEVPFSLKKIHSQLQIQLKSQMKAQALALYSEHNVSLLLHTFEKIVDLIKESESDEIVMSNLTKDRSFSKAEYRDHLKHYLEKLSSENDRMENTMFKNHEEILDFRECIIDLSRTVCGLLDDLKD